MSLGKNIRGWELAGCEFAVDGVLCAGQKIAINMENARIHARDLIQPPELRIVLS